MIPSGKFPLVLALGIFKWVLAPLFCILSPHNHLTALTLQFFSRGAWFPYAPISFSSWSLRSQEGGGRKHTPSLRSGRPGTHCRSTGPDLFQLVVQASHNHHLVSTLDTAGMGFQWYSVESGCPHHRLTWMKCFLVWWNFALLCL